MPLLVEKHASKTTDSEKSSDEAGGEGLHLPDFSTFDYALSHFLSCERGNVLRARVEKQSCVIRVVQDSGREG